MTRSRAISSEAYRLLQKASKRISSPKELFNQATVSIIRDGFEFGKNRLGIVETIQKWKNWDSVETSGWIHQNVEQAIDEIDLLWPKIRAIALRLKNSGAVSASTLRQICSDIVGIGLCGDKEIQTITAFYYDSIYLGCPMLIAVEEGVASVKLDALDQGSFPRLEKGTSVLVEHLRGRMKGIATGADTAAAAGRLFLLHYNGNYTVADGELCAISMPVDPISGKWSDISQPPEILHPMPQDYALCARYILHFITGGFLWPTIAALAENEAELKAVEQVVDIFWIPEVFRAYYRIADPQWAASADSVGHVAGLFARVVAIEGWFNPVVMREKLKEIFMETAVLLLQHRQSISQLEEGLRCGMTKPGEIISFCGGAVDWRFEENPRYGILMRYMRERVLPVPAKVEGQENILITSS